MNKKLTWRELKALHQLYLTGETRAKIQNNHYIKNILQEEKGMLEPKFGKANVFIVVGNCKTTFKSFYENEFLANYNSYYDFFERLGEKIGEKARLVKYSQLKEYDIKRLLEIEKTWTSKELQDLKQQIENARENLQGISAMFFKSPKYISNSTNRTSLENVVKALLGVEKFPQNDKQYLYVLHCKSKQPKIIILCENLYFLKLPHYADENDIELWYAGGNNIAKLEKIPKIDYPIYYLCDWDYDGLKIFERVKQKINQIKLITPNGNPKGIQETEEHHSSQWLKTNTDLCGLNKSDYTEKQLEKITLLIEEDNWIEEEDNDFNQIAQKIQTSQVFKT